MIGRRLFVVRVCVKPVTMEEQQREEAPPVKPEKKVTLQDLEEVDLLQKWTINLRILLEPISFLRYAVIVSIILHVQRPHTAALSLPNNTSDCATLLYFCSYCVC